MADSSQELMVRIRGDSSGVEQAAGRATKSVDGLNVTTQKATGAMRQFANDLKNARDASDLVGIAANALGKILASSIAGTAVLVAGKTLIDTFNKVKQAVDESKQSIEKAFSDIQRSSKALNLGEAQSQANRLYSEIEKIETKVKEIEASKLQNFVAQIIGAKDEMAKLAMEAKNVADNILRQGIQAEAANIAVSASLTEIQKAGRAAAEPYNILIELARQLKDASLVASLTASQQAAVRRAESIAQAELDKKTAEEKKAETEKQAKLEQEIAQQQAKLEAEIREAEFKAREDAKKIEEDFEKARQERHLAELQRSAQRIGSIEAEIEKLKERSAAAQEAAEREFGGRAAEGLKRGGEAGPFGPQRKTSLELGAERRRAKAVSDAQFKAREELIKQEKQRLKESGEEFFDRIAAVNSLTEKAKNEAVRREKERILGKKPAEDFSKQLQESQKELQKSKDAQAELDSLTKQNAKNYFDINKNAKNLIDEFLNAGGSAEGAADSLDQLDKQIGETLGEGAAGAQGGPQALATEATLSKVLTELKDNLTELRTYAFIT